MTPRCEFVIGGAECGKPAVVRRTLEHEAYGLCARHAAEDAAILGLDAAALEATDRTVES